MGLRAPASPHLSGSVHGVSEARVGGRGRRV
eukprot:CAMPEP_0176153068 /NCGR_PEP_ID=MMETSP0120_2-20121206/78182_1 /TAXON_ID=160619 /ORGANISM="Kryptoperidinium foliaceum, Strain CCMP 1326" /LENGTH=30 /DNA_ID= /DNA_START= /DNA_END= /DNA_ORIENTATION=